MFKFFKASKNDNREIELMGIGDLVIDTFIELIDAWIEDDNPQKKQELCMRFGDKIPYQKEITVPATGNSINAICAANKLGLKTGVISNVGQDESGEESIKYLKDKGIETQHIISHGNQQTNHNFILRFRAERTILVHHNEYQYKLPEFKAPKWLYLSSLAKNSLPYHDEIVDFLKKNPETKLAFQPGTFQIKLGSHKLAGLYALTEVFFCNKEEAQKILETTESDIKILLKSLAKLGPKIVVITDGKNGAYVLDSHKNEMWFGPMYPDLKMPVDRTGAGDSFAATFTVALIKGKSIKEALMWAPINSMSVVQFIGAQAGHLSEEEIESYLQKAPANYQAKIIT